MKDNNLFIKHLCLIGAVLGSSICLFNFFWFFIAIITYLISIIMDYYLNHRVSSFKKLLFLKLVVPVSAFCGCLISLFLKEPQSFYIIVGLVYCSYVFVFYPINTLHFTAKRLCLTVLIGAIPLLSYIFILFQIPTAYMGIAGTMLYCIFYLLLFYYLLSFRYIYSVMMSLADAVLLFITYGICGHDPSFNMFSIGVIMLAFIKVLIAYIITFIKTAQHRCVFFKRDTSDK